MKKQAVLVPGAVLKESFIDEYHISVAKIAEDIGLSPSAVRQLMNNKLKISIKIAWKLSQYFGTPLEYWIDMQNNYDIAELEKNGDFMACIKAIPKAKKSAAPEKAAARSRGKQESVKEEPKPARRKNSPKAAAVQEAAADAIHAEEKRVRKPRAQKTVEL